MEIDDCKLGEREEGCCGKRNAWTRFAGAPPNETCSPQPKRSGTWTLASLKEKKGRRGLGGRMRASQLHSTPKCHAYPFHPDCTTARLLCFGDDRSEFLQRARASLRRYSGSWTAHRRRRSAGDGQRARPALRQLSPLLQPRLLGSDAALVPAAGVVGASPGSPRRAASHPRR